MYGRAANKRHEPLFGYTGSGVMQAKFDDDLLLAWDYAHGYTNPVTKDKWPKAHTGENKPIRAFYFSTFQI